MGPPGVRGRWINPGPCRYASLVLPSFVRSPCDSNPRSISMLTDQQISPRKLPNFSSLRQESRFRKSFLKRPVTSAGRLRSPSGVCLLNKLMRCNFVSLGADGLLRVSFCVRASANSARKTYGAKDRRNKQ